MSSLRDGTKERRQVAEIRARDAGLGPEDEESAVEFAESYLAL